jgi:pectinesterase
VLTQKQLQSAVDSLSTTSTTAQSIFIQAGTYTEQVYIAARAAKLTIYGYTTDTTSYASNVVTIQHSSSLASGATDDDHTGVF